MLNLKETKELLEPLVVYRMPDTQIESLQEELQTMAEVFVDIALSEQTTTPEGIGTLSE